MPSADNRETVGVVPDADEAMALLRSADADYQAGNLAAAKLACETLIAGDRLTSWAYFFLGRILRDEANDDRATAAFTRAIEGDGSLFWAHSERLVLARRRGESPDRLERFVRDMAAIAWEPLQAAHVHLIEAVAQTLWAAGRIESAHLLFERLWPSADLSPLALLRIVEADRDAAMVAEADRRIATLPEIYDGVMEILIEHLDHHGGRDRKDPSNGPRGPYADKSPDDASAATRIRRGAGATARRDSADLTGTQRDDVRQIEAIAHALWDSDHFDTAHRIFERIWRFPDLRLITLVRVIEANRDPVIVAKAVERLLNLSELNATAFRILGQHFENHGVTDAEITLLERHYAASPSNFPIGLWLVRAYARKGDTRAAAAVVNAEATIEPHQRSLAKLWAYIELGDHEAAFHAFRDHVRLHGQAPKDAGTQLVYVLGDASDIARRDEVLALVSAYHVGDPDIALLHVHAAMRDQKWEEARALFDERFGDAAGRPENARLTDIQINAFSGKLETATALLDRERIDGVVPPVFVPAALRIFGELDRWQEAFDTGIANLAGDPSFEHVLSVVIRAGRRTGRSEELFDALLALPRPLRKQHQDTLFAVMEDLAEAGRADIVERAGDIALPRERERRIRLKLRAAGASTAAQPRRDLCIYYCADEPYLTPALVSITALAMSNIGLARRAAIKLVVESSVIPRAAEATRAIAGRLGFAVEVIDAATIVPSTDRLRTSYGLHTGGQELALAAYYRIFFARHLAEGGEYEQALYIDADTIVRGGLDELFSLDRTASLMARHETDRPEVRYAADVHRLKGRYFNSGILLFDLAHPELPALLDRAIEAALDPAVKLIFQDQCALNIAFDTRIDELPARFNYFNPPNVSADGIAATDAVIIHFLDRPKPWDSLYRRPAREWFDWFDLVETLRGGDLRQAG